jgi:diketogulonate reductase-like aldo/keto reductase
MSKNLAALTKCVKLNSGHRMPMMSLGCYFGAPGDWTADDVTQAVKDAISVGYRALDTAAIYGTETAVGKGIKAKIADGTVKREEIFVTTKLSYTDYVPAKVRPALEKSLAALDLDYIDLYLIHFPFAITVEENAPAVLTPDTVLDQSYDHLKTWKVLESCVKEGKIRSIGISNFNARQVQNMLDNAEIPPAINQVEIHPYLRNEKLVNYCQTRGVNITAYTPLGQPHSSWAKSGWVSPLQHPVIMELATKYKRGAGQIALRYQAQRDITLTAKSSNPARLAQNLDIFDFEISSADMDKISALDKNDRVNLFPPASAHKEYPFHDEF